MLRLAASMLLVLSSVVLAGSAVAADCGLCLDTVTLQTRDGQRWTAGQPVTLVVHVAANAAVPLPSTAQAVRLLNDWDPAAPVLVVLGPEEAAAGKSFRNLAEAQALPVEDVGVADLVGAASLLVSESALSTLVSRAGARETRPEAGDAEAGD